MNSEIVIPEDEDFFIVRPSQNVTREFAKEFCKQAVQYSEETARRRLLIDLRGRRSRSSIIDKYEFAYRDSRDLGLRRFLRVALCSDAPEEDGLGFFETVMCNSGHCWKVFADQTTALDWIHYGDDASPGLYKDRLA